LRQGWNVEGKRVAGQEQKKASIKEFSLVKGLIVATISGILSAV